ncbi:LuxR family transcriptional regulator [Kineococcus sp. NUM-3379]
MALHGRTDESAVLGNLLRAATGGSGGTLVVRGVAGIGKSVLVDHAVQATATTSRVRDLRVLRATGVEFEADLAFAGLHQLCSPLLEHLGELPAPQADALRSALGLGGQPAAPEAALLVGAGLLALLAAAARVTPVVCVVDDVQWLDEASTKALAFAARRLDDVPVALLLVVRDGEPDDEPAAAQILGRLPHLRLAGLRDRDARALLAAEVRAPIDPRVRDRVVAEARGNPLALVELPRTFSPAELAGGYGLPDDESVPAVLESSFRHRLMTLPAASLAFVTLAAAEPTGDPALLWRAVREAGLSPRAALPAEATGLLSVGTTVRFRHPLVRSAVYRAAGLSERRAAHRALALATDPQTDPDRRAWHLALAADGPDEEVAAELVRSADRAQARGGLAATGAFLERAAALSPDPARRAERLVSAAVAKRAAGAPEAAVELLAAAENGVLDVRQRAHVVVLRARTAFDRRRDADAVEGLLTAGRSVAAVDVDTARDVLLEAFAAAVYTGRFADRGLIPLIAGTLRSLPRPVDHRDPMEQLHEGFLAQVLHGPAVATPLLRAGVAQALSDVSGPLRTSSLWLVCSAAQETWDEASFRTIADRQLTGVRRAGAVASLPIALSYRALAHVHAGEFDAAQALVDECHRVAVELEVPPMLHVDVTISAWRGDDVRTAELLRKGMHDATVRQEGRLLTALEYAQTVLLNGQGRYAEALEVCRVPVELAPTTFQVWIPAEFVEAAVRSGHPDLAMPVLDRLRESARAAGSDWAAGMLARCTALVTVGPEAEASYRAAVEHLALTHAAPQLARTHLLYGEWLRREGRKREAREQLRTAHDAFSALGAAAFAARAARELAATGERARARGAGDPEQPAPLTAQELQVARLVGGGATSKEVAAELFLSPRTVDAHLRNIFAKLGVTSRRQLRDLPLPAGPEERGAILRKM